jgi:hypothetical protein
MVVDGIVALSVGWFLVGTFVGWIVCFASRRSR